MISVIIPVYNVEKYLEKCLRSVVNNTYRDLEIICINDGSTDHCLDKLQMMQADDDRIRIINQNNQGVQEARNKGLQESKGEYIAFLDSDDWVHPQYFQSLLQCMEKTKAHMVICGCRKVNEEEIIDTNYHKHICYHRLSAYEFSRSYFAKHMIWGRLLRRNEVDGLWFDKDLRISEDTLYNLNIISGIQSPIVYETETPLYFYTQRNDSIVHTTDYQCIGDFPTWYVKNNKTNKRKDCGGSWSWILIMQAVKMALSYRYGAWVHRDYKRIKNANVLLCSIIVDMLRNQQISFKDKVIHTAMFVSALLYRSFRLWEDPTNKKWEKMVRSKNSRNE